MLKYLYSVKDTQSGIFGPIVERRAMSDVVRDLTEMVNEPDKNKQVPYARYPHHFHLYRVGMFNDESGEMMTKTVPEPIMALTEVMLNTHPMYSEPPPVAGKGPSVVPPKPKEPAK